MRGEESSPDPVAVVGEPLPARRRSTLEDLFSAPKDDDSSREEGLLDEGLHLDADGNPLETRVELVMEKVGERPTMVAALEPVLDAEAEAFAEKLWAVLPRGEG